MAHRKTTWNLASAVVLLGACTEPGHGDLDDDPPHDDTAGASEDGEGSTSQGDGLRPQDVPCRVQRALANGCGLCHGSSPAFGAPMPLAHRDDFMVPAPSDPARPTHDLVVERMTAQLGVMPPNGEISDEDAAAILDWIDDGLPPGTSCEDPPEDDDGLEQPLPCQTPHRLLAHADGSDAPFAVPTQGADNLYQCFAFRSPFADGEQATAWGPIIDDERVVHHWLLYRTSVGGYTDGAVFPCSATLQLSAELVAGWAPGGTNTIMPDDVGLDLGTPDDWWILQIHYNNTAQYTDVSDQSGVELCTTPTPRHHTAGMLTLGTVDIDVPPGASDHGVTGTCGPASTELWPEPMHLIVAFPHMHEFGRSFRTEVVRASGARETVVDIPAFDYSNQPFYPLDPQIVVNPGDTLNTTCIYDNPTDQAVGFGEGTSDEMCFDFVIAYPIDQLPKRNCFDD